MHYLYYNYVVDVVGINLRVPQLHYYCTCTVVRVTPYHYGLFAFFL